MSGVPRVGIVGAGIAGLSCAQSLLRAGIPVVLFDKARGAGGRMCTRRNDNWQVDHGTQYFTARDPVFQAELARWCAAGVAAPWRPRIAVFGENASGSRDGETERFVGVPAMSAPARWLAAPLSLIRQIVVGRIERGATRWTISAADDTASPADAAVFDILVLALPAPQAHRLLAGGIGVPAHLAELAGSVRMLPCWAALLHYDQHIPLPFDAAFVNQGPLRWAARDSAKPGRVMGESWVLHASNAWSQAHLEESQEAIIPGLLDAFQEIGGTPPAAWLAHRWRYADIEAPLTIASTWDATARIGLCGDWLNGGRVEGAWLSGLSLATRIAQSLAP